MRRIPLVAVVLLSACHFADGLPTGTYAGTYHATYIAQGATPTETRTIPWDGTTDASITMADRDDVAVALLGCTSNGNWTNRDVQLASIRETAPCALTIPGVGTERLHDFTGTMTYAADGDAVTIELDAIGTANEAWQSDPWLHLRFEGRRR